jgi:hypothetical protein
MPVILAEIDWPKWISEELASKTTGITQTMPGRGIENLASRQNGRQRKKQWASAKLAKVLRQHCRGETRSAIDRPLLKLSAYEATGILRGTLPRTCQECRWRSC